ncbi:hypothetical protein V8C35DRAFT_90341 [Trichoderma chlorosporum]
MRHRQQTELCASKDGRFFMPVFSFSEILCNLSASCSRGRKYRWRPKTPIPALRRTLASALLLQDYCNILPAEITTATPRFVPRSQPILSANCRLCDLPGALLGIVCCDICSIPKPWQRGRSLSAEASSIIQSKAPRRSCHQICRPIPALSTRLQARPFAHRRKRRSRISNQSYKPSQATSVALCIGRLFEQDLWVSADDYQPRPYWQP